MAADPDDVADGSDDGLMLEDNSDDDSIQLEENDDDDELQLEDNDDDELQLEDNDDGDDLQLEDNDDDGDVDELELEANDDDESLALEQNESEAPQGQSADDGLQEALLALGGQDASTRRIQDGSAMVGSINTAMGTIVNANGELIDPVEELLVPDARTKLENAQVAYPRKPNESDADWHCRLSTILTANDPLEAFVAAADKIMETFGPYGIADRMRLVGDDHFAAGFYTSACHCYTAGIMKHDPNAGTASLVVRCHLNRAAALLKLGETKAAIQDANDAVRIAKLEGSGIDAKMLRKALLRRAQTLLELGRLEEAQLDLEEIGPEKDAAASRLLSKVLAQQQQ